MVRPVTAFLMVAAFLLAVTWPLELWGRPTRRSPLAVRRAFASRLTLHTGGILVCLVGAGVGAMLISRQAKREYRDAALRNMRTLVEGEDSEPLSPPGERGRGKGPSGIG